MTVKEPGHAPTTYKGVFSGNGKGIKNCPDKGGIPFKGPVPPGEYYLGYPVDVSPTHPALDGDLMWVPILNKNSLKSSVFVTNPETGKLVVRDEMYVHPGTISEGCVTFPSDSAKGQKGYPKSRDFSDLKSRLMNTKPLEVEGVRQIGREYYPVTERFPGVIIVK